MSHQHWWVNVTSCPHCQLNTAGQHEAGCPFNDRVKIKVTYDDNATTWPRSPLPIVPPNNRVGWQCPGCSRCYAPHISSCFHCGPKA